MVSASLQRLVVACVMLLALGADRAAAQAPPVSTVRLIYTRGEGTASCPDERTLRESVAARLGYDPFYDPASDPSHRDKSGAVSAVLSRGSRGLRVVVQLLDAEGRVTGSRLLTTARNDCQELFSAMALAICIAVDPFVLSRSPAKEEPPPAPLAPPCPTCPSCPPPPRSAVRFRVGAGLQAGIGAVPTLGSLGVTAQVDLRYRAFALILEGRIDPRLGGTPGPMGGSVGATLLLGIIAPCARWRLLGFCALIGMGALQGVGLDVTTSRQATTFYAAAGARLAVEVPLHRLLALDLHLDGLTPLTYTTLSLDAGEVWSTPPLSGALGANLQVLFP